MPSAKKPVDKVQVALRDWRTFQKTLTKLSLADVERAIGIEQQGKKRKAILTRLATRAHRLRCGTYVQSVVQQYNKRA